MSKLTFAEIEEIARKKALLRYPVKMEPHRAIIKLRAGGTRSTTYNTDSNAELRHQYQLAFIAGYQEALKNI